MSLLDPDDHAAALQAMAANGRVPMSFSHGDFDGERARIEEGAEVRLPYRALQFGDLRCNRVTWGAFVGDRYVPVLDDIDPRDLAARDRFFETFRGPLGHGSLAGRAARAARAVASHPAVVPAGVGVAARLARRAGGLRSVAGGVRPTTFVMHRFIDAADTAAAWSHLEGGTTPPAELIATIERLQACAYSMPHPDAGRMIPACVQHAVLDPIENAQLVELLPRRPRTGNLPAAARVSSP